MYISKILIKNFKSIEKEEIIPFCKGLTVITGPNGSGKSNLIESMKFTLCVENITDMTNQPSTTEKSKILSKLIKTDKSFSSVKIFFELKRNSISFERQLIKTSENSIEEKFIYNGKEATKNEYIDFVRAVNADKIVARETSDRFADKEKIKSLIGKSKIFVTDDMFLAMPLNECKKAAGLIKKLSKNRQIIVVSNHKPILETADSILITPIEDKKYKISSLVLFRKNDEFNVINIS